jgi:hypothetical protein
VQDLHAFVHNKYFILLFLPNAEDGTQGHLGQYFVILNGKCPVVALQRTAWGAGVPQWRWGVEPSQLSSWEIMVAEAMTDF